MVTSNILDGEIQRFLDSKENGKNQASKTLTLTALGRVQGPGGGLVGSLWRVRNASDQDKWVTVKAYGGKFEKNFVARARAVTDFISDFTEGRAVHVLIYNEKPIDSQGIEP